MPKCASELARLDMLRMACHCSTTQVLEQAQLSVVPGYAHQIDCVVQGLLDANSQCHATAAEMVETMNSLKQSAKHRAWKSFRQAFRSFSSEAKLRKSLSKRMTQAREQLMVSLLVQIR